MNKVAGHLNSFTQLLVWQEAHKLVVGIYKATKGFPKDELFGLTSQIRRAAVSVTSNIAEGFGRLSWSEKVHFFSFAHGSLTEVQNQLLVARDVGHIREGVFTELYAQTVTIEKLLRGLQKKTGTIARAGHS